MLIVTYNSFTQRSVVQSLSCVWFFCDPMNCSLQVSSVHRISQARILEGITISFSRGSSQPRDQIYISCIGTRILYHWVTEEALYPEKAYVRFCFIISFWILCTHTHTHTHRSILRLLFFFFSNLTIYCGHFSWQHEKFLCGIG